MRIIHPMAGRGIMAGAMWLGRAFRHVVMVVWEEALEEEHQKETAQDPVHRLVQRLILMCSVGDKMEQRYAEHKPGDEAHRHLQARMCKTHGQQQPTARERGQQHKSAIDAEQRRERYREVAHPRPLSK